MHVLCLSPWKFAVLLMCVNDSETMKKIELLLVREVKPWMLSVLLKLNNSMSQRGFISESQKAELRPP